MEALAKHMESPEKVHELSGKRVVDGRTRRLGLVRTTNHLP
jgi:hypothetical protein